MRIDIRLYRGRSLQLIRDQTGPGKEFVRNFIIAPWIIHLIRVSYLVLQMLRQKNYLVLGVLGCILLLSATTADNSVHILSKYGHQPLTSTTLKWLPVAHYNPSESKEIVIGGVENVLDGEGATTITLFGS